jgi:hypothetical protein
MGYDVKHTMQDCILRYSAPRVGFRRFRMRVHCADATNTQKTNRPVMNCGVQRQVYDATTHPALRHALVSVESEGVRSARSSNLLKNNKCTGPWRSRMRERAEYTEETGFRGTSKASRSLGACEKKAEET